MDYSAMVWRSMAANLTEVGRLQEDVETLALWGPEAESPNPASGEPARAGGEAVPEGSGE